MLRLHSRAAQCALHFTISPVIARRTCMYMYVPKCTYTRDAFMQPKTRYTRCMRRVYEANISYAAVRPHTISDRCLWPDTILRRALHIFLPVTFVLRILINRDLGHRCVSTYVSLISRCVRNKRDIRSRFIKQYDETNVI